MRAAHLGTEWYTGTHMLCLRAELSSTQAALMKGFYCIGNHTADVLVSVWFLYLAMLIFWQGIVQQMPHLLQNQLLNVSCVNSC